MSAPDASVWTSEPLSGEGPTWYWGRDEVCSPAPYPRDVLDVFSLKQEHCEGFVRSILPVPSAERHAALEAVAEAAKEGERLEEAACHFGEVGTGNVTRWEGLVERIRAADQRLTAALARLEATRG